MGQPDNREAVMQATTIAQDRERTEKALAARASCDQRCCLSAGSSPKDRGNRSTKGDIRSQMTAAFQQLTT